MPTSASKSPSANETLEAKRAVEAAWEYFHTLFNSVSAFNVSLEEVELSDDGTYWLVTLSFEEMRAKKADLPDFLRVPRQKFKVFKVERSTGRVTSMKMRDAG